MRLFKVNENTWVTYNDIVQACLKVDAHKCEALFIHTELSFGILNKELKRTELLDIIYDSLCELGVKTLIFPTFTFSFANGEEYNVQKSTCKMGMMNEYMRKRNDAIRSLDPMMSVCMIGENRELMKVEGNKSLGEGSFFDRFHKAENSRIMFFGTEMRQCNTHMHYVEERLRVPYRYDKEFNGTIIDYDGKEKRKTQILYVKYRDILPNVPIAFEEDLIQSGLMKKVKLGKSYISSFKEKAAYEKTVEWLKRDVNCFLEEPHNTKPFVKEYSYGNVTTVQ
jgi:aminoglycoside 3-N-acetyltransferase